MDKVMRRLPPLAAIRAFEAAARTENFTAAAAELGMTQAAVSYQVKSLEERLGAPLFVREKGRARLTPLGARLLPPLASRECIAAVERKLGRKLEPKDLPDQNLISPGDEWWQQWFADNGVPADEAVLRRRGIRLENQSNEGHAAMAGQGFALLTPLLWKGDIAAGRLCVPFPDRISSRQWAYWLVFPRERRMVPKVKRFREWLLEEMRIATEQIDGGWAAQGRTPEIAQQTVG